LPPKVSEKMNTQDLVKPIARATSSKIVLMVLDGLGGLPDPKTGKTELETSRTPNLDKLAADGVCGLSVPVAYGITPGSAPGHTAIFGYDPLTVNIGRGVLEAVGIDLPIQQGDILARGNFCTIDAQGNITDRRAGRVATEVNSKLCKMLETKIDDVQISCTPVKEHRFVVSFRGANLNPDVTESDPQLVGVPPLEINALQPAAKKMAEIANKYSDFIKKTLASEHPANMALLRGFSQKPHLPSMEEIYKLKPAAIATYPMYRGLARLVGMEILKTGTTIEDEVATLREHWADYDFFFFHVKKLDAAGEDGDFARKVQGIEEIDRAMPGITALNPDVLVITGDHSTPAVLKGHSWHPVPTLLHAQYCRPDAVKTFSESECLRGGLGTFPATSIMPLALANALKLNKYGA
jgi:2,3-bisphosphoglycerate-independent phosphoglycerate mutase